MLKKVRKHFHMNDRGDPAVLDRKRAICCVLIFVFLMGAMPLRASASETDGEIVENAVESAEKADEAQAELPEEETAADGDQPFAAAYRAVPLYFQTDHPETMYGAGSVATNGSSITALAMVATYMTGHEYLPDELARYFGGTAENNIRRLEIGSEAMQLPFYRSRGFSETMQALREGKVAIALMEGTSLFSSAQHFIVLTGLDETGKIMVNDPYGPNYERSDLKHAFAEGFDEESILFGYSGAWIYDKSTMPADPFLYSEPEPERGEPRYPDIQLTAEEKRLLAKLVWAEARGESPEGQQAVAEVVLNRMVYDGFGHTLKGVIFAEGQFCTAPYLEEVVPDQAQFEAVEAAIYGPYVLPEGVVYFATYAINDDVWGTIGGHVFCYG